MILVFSQFKSKPNFELDETQTKDFKEFDYKCFYFEEIIVNEQVLENHRKVCCEKYSDEPIKTDFRNDFRVRETNDLNRKLETHHNFGFPPIMMPTSLAHLLQRT